MISVISSTIQAIRFGNGKLVGASHNTVVKKRSSSYGSTLRKAVQSPTPHENYFDFKLASRRNRKQRLKSPHR